MRIQHFDYFLPNTSPTCLIYLQLYEQFFIWTYHIWNLSWNVPLTFHTEIRHQYYCQFVSHMVHFEIKSNVANWILKLVIGALDYGKQAHNAYTHFTVAIQQFIGMILDRNCNAQQLQACKPCYEPTRAQHELAQGTHRPKWPNDMWLDLNCSGIWCPASTTEDNRKFWETCKKCYHYSSY